MVRSITVGRTSIPLSWDTHAWPLSVHKAVTLVDAEVAVVASTSMSGGSLVGEEQASPP